MPDIEPFVTDRGLRHMTPIEGVHVYESSNADEPKIWVNMGSLHAHLTLDDARQLAQQILWLCDHHYQVEPPSGTMATASG